MPWGLVIVRSAEKQLRKVQAKDRKRIITALVEMRGNPFGGDIAYLKGQGTTFRRQVGNWRILFDIHAERRLVVVTAVKPRTSATY